MVSLSKRIIALFVLAALLPFLTGATIVIRGPRIPAAGGGAGDFTLISSVGTGGTTNGVTSGSIDTTGANLLVVAISYYPPSGTPTITDSASNTWTALTASGDIYAGTRLFYCYNPTTSSTHTFSVSLSASYPSIIATAWSGSAASPEDQQTGATSGGSWTTLNPGSITPTQANTLCVSALGFANNTGGVVSVGDSYTIAQTVSWSQDNRQGLSLAYKILTSATAQNPQWSISATCDSGAARITSFKD